MPSALPVTLTAVSCSSPQICVAVGGQAITAPLASIAARSTDGGREWASTLFGAASAQPSALVCPTALRCIAVGGRIVGTTDIGSAIRSEDGGRSWTVVSKMPKGVGQLTSISCPVKGFCMAVGSSVDRLSGVALGVDPVWKSMETGSASRRGEEPCPGDLQHPGALHRRRRWLVRGLHDHPHHVERGADLEHRRRAATDFGWASWRRRNLVPERFAMLYRRGLPRPRRWSVGIHLDQCERGSPLDLRDAAFRHELLDCRLVRDRGPLCGRRGWCVAPRWRGALHTHHVQWRADLGIASCPNRGGWTLWSVLLNGRRVHGSRGRLRQRNPVRPAHSGRSGNS